ncbi:hypothetical protein J132_11141 [Termitomyces sp. J132]|nr:hypothetical protein J132_11141 [Termitomyces sp. J132]
MTFISLLKKLFTKFRSPPKIVGPIELPLDVLEVIVDQADVHTQLKLSLVSRRIMRRSRNVLFDTLIFVGSGFLVEYAYAEMYETGNHDHRLDRLFKLLESPSETIASSVRTIQIGNLFRTSFKYRARDNVHFLATKFCNLTTFRLISIEWDNIPAHILEFFLALCPHEVQLEHVCFRRTGLFVRLFRSRFITNARKISLFSVSVDTANAKNITPLTLQHPKQVFHFPIIDVSSLVNFYELWNDDFIRSSVTINSFHLGYATHYIESYGKEIAISFIKKVLRLIEPDIESLFVDVQRYQFSRDLYAQDNLSQCTTVKVLKLLIPTVLEHRQVHDVENVWMLIGGLPSAHIERIDLILNIRYLRDEGLPEKLRSVSWIDTARRLQNIFPLLKHVQFIFGDRSRADVFLPSILEAIGSDIRKIGLVNIDINFRPYFLHHFREPEVPAALTLKLSHD